MSTQLSPEMSERYITDATFHARAYVAAEAIHRFSGFDPDWSVWPCGACLDRAIVALDAVDRVLAKTPAAGVDAQVRRATAHDRDMNRDPYLRRDVAALGGDPSL